MSYAILFRPESAALFLAAFDEHVRTHETERGPVAYIESPRIDLTTHIGFVLAALEEGKSLLIPSISVAAIWEGETTKEPPGFLRPAAPAM